jgi:hypothetical protein
VPFLQFDWEIRSIICTTNAIESINARLRRAVNGRGHFPTEQAAMKCLYLALMSLHPSGKGRGHCSNRKSLTLPGRRRVRRRRPRNSTTPTRGGVSGTLPPIPWAVMCDCGMMIRR